jgi:hypothetical protein
MTMCDKGRSDIDARFRKWRDGQTKKDQHSIVSIPGYVEVRMVSKLRNIEKCVVKSFFLISPIEGLVGYRA